MTEEDLAAIEASYLRHDHRAKQLDALVAEVRRLREELEASQEIPGTAAALAERMPEAELRSEVARLLERSVRLDISRHEIIEQRDALRAENIALGVALAAAQTLLSDERIAEVFDALSTEESPPPTAPSRAR